MWKTAIPFMDCTSTVGFCQCGNTAADLFSEDPRSPRGFPFDFCSDGLKIPRGTKGGEHPGINLI